MDYKMLVNRTHKLEKEVYENEIVPNIIEIKTKKNNDIVFKTFGIEDSKTYLESKTAEKFKKLQDFASQNGIIIDVTSGYLSFEQQNKKYNYFIEKGGQEWADKSSCPAGYSEHNTGLAIDFDIFINGHWGGIALGKNGSTNQKAKWIHKHLHEFGFILRYPEGKENITKMKYEPWHIRYVGEELAEYLYQNNLTLEEYYEQKNLR